MSDDKDPSQQTEEPTQRRLDEAREHGDVVKSTELSTFIVLAGGTLSLALFGKSGAEGLAITMTRFLSEPEAMGTSGSDIMALMRSALWQTAIVMAPAVRRLLRRRPGRTSDSGTARLHHRTHEAGPDKIVPAGRP